MEPIDKRYPDGKFVLHHECEDFQVTMTFKGDESLYEIKQYVKAFLLGCTFLPSSVDKEFGKDI